MEFILKNRNKAKQLWVKKDGEPPTVYVRNTWKELYSIMDKICKKGAS